MGKIMSKENIKKNIPYLQNVKEVGFHYEGESYPPTYIYIYSNIMIIKLKKYIIIVNHI